MSSHKHHHQHQPSSSSQGKFKESQPDLNQRIGGAGVVVFHRHAKTKSWCLTLGKDLCHHSNLADFGGGCNYQCKEPAKVASRELAEETSGLLAIAPHHLTFAIQTSGRKRSTYCCYSLHYPGISDREFQKKRNEIKKECEQKGKHRDCHLEIASLKHIEIDEIERAVHKYNKEGQGTDDVIVKDVYGRTYKLFARVVSLVNLGLLDHIRLRIRTGHLDVPPLMQDSQQPVAVEQQQQQQGTIDDSSLMT